MQIVSVYMVTPIDWHDFTVLMWGSEVPNYKAKIYILQNATSKVMWSCNDTIIEREGEECKSSVF